MTAKKQTIALPEEIASLARSSNTRPGILVLKLFTDRLQRDYEAKAAALWETRGALIHDLHTEVALNKLTYQLMRQGAKIKVEANTHGSSFPSDDTDAGKLFKSVDLNAPRSTRSGAKRLLDLKQMNTGAAYLYLLMDSAYSSQSGGSYLKPLAKYWGGEVDHSRASFGLRYEDLVIQNKGSAGAELTISIKMFPDLAKRLEALVAEELKLIKGMYADLKVLTASAGKMSNIETLLKRMPAMLERDDLKEMLGFDINPQAERVAQLSKVLSGEAFVNL